MNVTALSNEDLVARVRTINAGCNRLLAELLVHLGEVDARKLYTHHACSSMFVFCRKLGMSEGATCRRLDSARAVRRFPSLLPRIESGELHLTALSIVSGLLTPENVESVIASVAGKTKREVLEVRARLAPGADVKDLIRKLPEPKPIIEVATPAPPPVAAPVSPPTVGREPGHAQPSLSLLSPPPVDRNDRRRRNTDGRRRHGATATGGGRAIKGP